VEHAHVLHGRQEDLEFLARTEWLELAYPKIVRSVEHPEPPGNLPVVHLAREGLELVPGEVLGRHDGGRRQRRALLARQRGVEVGVLDLAGEVDGHVVIIDGDGR
jgi:hypothetical protein